MSMMTRVCVDDSWGDAVRVSFDECFFILRKSCNRAIATQDPNTASLLILWAIKCISSQILPFAASLLVEANDHMKDLCVYGIRESLLGDAAETEANGREQSHTISSSFTHALSLAASTTVALTSGGTSTIGTPVTEKENYTSTSQEHSESDLLLMAASGCLDMYNIINELGKYTSRLQKCVLPMATSVFQQDTSSGSIPALSGASGMHNQLSTCQHQFDAAVKELNQVGVYAV